MERELNTIQNLLYDFIGKIECDDQTIINFADEQMTIDRLDEDKRVIYCTNSEKCIPYHTPVHAKELYTEFIDNMDAIKELFERQHQKNEVFVNKLLDKLEERIIAKK